MAPFNLQRVVFLISTHQGIHSAVHTLVRGLEEMSLSDSNKPMVSVSVVVVEMRVTVAQCLPMTPYARPPSFSPCRTARLRGSRLALSLILTDRPLL